MGPGGETHREPEATGTLSLAVERADTWPTQLIICRDVAAPSPLRAAVFLPPKFRKRAARCRTLWLSSTIAVIP